MNCKTSCSAKGYRFAGVQNSNQCFCGNEEPPSARIAPEGDCKKKCIGDSTQFCGGYWRMNVYDTHVWTGQCVVDDGSRLLDHHISVSSITPMNCKAGCSVKGYSFSGVQNANQCFCGNEEPPLARIAPEGDCKQKCVGDTTQFCGGVWRMNVYDTHVWTGQCVVDDGSRLLDNHISVSPLTPINCKTSCSAKGYIFAGVQNSNECFCGNEEPPLARIAPEDECKKKCIGDSTQFCGGFWRMNVYNTHISTPTKTTPPTTTTTTTTKTTTTTATTAKSKTKTIAFWNGQCVVDDGSRLLDNHISVSPLSPMNCKTSCSAKGYRFAGVQNSNQCFCGNEEPPSARIAPEGDCKKKCVGDSTQFCGGYWRMNVYDTNVWTGQCVVDDGSRLLDHHISVSSITPMNCKAGCSVKGYSFAGVQNANQCFCGNEEPPLARIAPEGDCKQKCVGDTTQFCGGVWRMNVYDTHVWTGQCVVDDGSRLLDNHISVSPLTPINCKTSCYAKGYSFAGVQNSNECFCGNEKPPSERIAPEGECKKKCIGDSTQFCGGFWRMNVYNTHIATPTKTTTTTTTTTTTAITTTAAKSKTKTIAFWNGQCVVDDGSRLLDKHISVSPLSPMNCKTSCSAKGYRFAGVQNSNECFCGNEEPPSARISPEGDCKKKCVGDSTQFCGGYWRMNVYDTHVWTGQCVVDDGSRLLDHHISVSSITPMNCKAGCSVKGYSFAGVQNANQCFCGNEEPPLARIAPAGDCKQKCAGDSIQFCGGVWRMNVYDTHVWTGQCVVDDGSRLLDIHISVSPLTPMNCKTSCSAKGYSFAGVQNSNECFCGNEEPPSAKIAPEGDCKKKCIGDSTQFCGGFWRMNVYNTRV